MSVTLFLASGLWSTVIDKLDMWFIAPLQYALLLRSLEAAIVVGIVSGVLGTYVVVRGMTFFGDALAHAILPGVAVAYQRTNGATDGLFWGGLAAGILSALGIGFLTRHERVKEDTAIGIVFTASFALGIAMISRMDNYAGDLTHILFGQILGVSAADLRLIVIFGAAVLVVVALFFKEFMIISFDPTLARTLRLPDEALRLLLLILIAVTIVVSLQTVGIALMIALLVTPAATANLLTHRLLPMMVVSAGLGAASSIVGFYLSYHQDIATGPAIVLTATAIFLAVFLIQQGANGLRFARVGLRLRREQGALPSAAVAPESER
ncbi:metal ABC transporter permease [Aggregatilinea lenta]|uniref:metal ABC transporter permease n=1 Tax=Aggregatilinea lenta TaxID=913108 RepID=UPI001EE8D7EA|nr:metal ABC transporter permease [Aggregatilinea lenta]